MEQKVNKEGFLQGTAHFSDHPRRENGHKVPADLSKFWVILVLSNPQRHKRRYELYWDTVKMCHDAGVRTITVEEAFGNRQFMVTEANNPYHLQVQSVEELWKKENYINLGIKHACRIAPGEVREVAWVDADCRPSRPYKDWFAETWHQLQHYEFVQMWEHLIDLDANYNPIGAPQPGFMANYIKHGTPNPIEFKELQFGSKRPRHGHHRHGHHEEHHHKHHHHHHHHPNPPPYPGELTVEKLESHHHHHHHHHHHGDRPSPYGELVFGRPGLAWAANLDALQKVGMLIDFAILGAADWYMAHALVGSLTVATGDYNGSRYVQKMMQWQERAERWIKRDVGYVQGIVYHDNHGKKQKRYYGTRGRILHNCNFDPDIDLKYDAYGVLQLETWEPRQIKLRDQVRLYMRARNDDELEYTEIEFDP